MTDSTISQKLTDLKKSKFRSKSKLTAKDRDYIAAKGLETIKEHAYQFIISRVAPDFPKNGGKQTPMRGFPVFIAQHATAICCRGYIQKWHGIEKDGAKVVETVSGCNDGGGSWEYFFTEYCCRSLFGRCEI